MEKQWWYEIYNGCWVWKISAKRDGNGQEIWDHCKLEGNYNPEKRKSHFAYTASMQQVTKDIYSSSLQKKDFSKFKDGFMEDLKTQREYWKKKINLL